MIRTILAALCAVSVLGAGTAHGQISPSSVGLRISSSSGASAGVLGCGPSPFTCNIGTITLNPAEQVTVQIRGQMGGIYSLVVTSGSIPCTPVPGVLNQLLIDPFSVLAQVTATMNQPDPILSCPGGIGTLTAPWPAALSGTTLFLQAVAAGPAGQLAFTNAVQATTP